MTVKNTASTPGYAPASTLKFYLSSDAVLDGGDVELTPAVSVPALAPGASFAAVPTLTIPASVATGARFLIARANALGNVPESDTTNNTAAAPLEIGDFADLQITAVAGPAAAGTGLPMTVSFTTRNAGVSPVGPFRVSLFMAAGPNPAPAPGDGAGVGFKDFPGLAAGASLASTLVVNLPAGFAAGSYFLSAVADAGNAIPESRRQRRFRAQRPRRRQDDRRHPTGPRGERAHRADPRRAGRHRRGHRDRQESRRPRPRGAPASSLKFYLSDDQTLDGTDVELSPARAIPVLGPGAVSTAATTLAIPASVTTGNKFILARADALDEVTEAQEGNNVTARAIEIGDFADLQITAVAGPAAAGTGRPMTVSFTTRNAGVAPVGPFRVNLFLAPAPNPAPAPGDGTGVGFKDFPGLAAGASLASTLVVDLPASFTAGSYFLSAVADAGNAIPETGGSDGVALNGRVAAKTITVIRPDLVVSTLTGPLRAARGGTAAVTATVKNLAASPATAPASSLKFYLSDDQTLDGTDVELSPARTVPALAAGGVSTAVTTLTIPPSVTTGNKFILARADALDQVIEAQEGNNVTARAIEIGDFADLQITAVAGPATVRAGQNMTVSFTVKNAGTAPVDTFNVTAYLAPAAPPPSPATATLSASRRSPRWARWRAWPRRWWWRCRTIWPPGSTRCPSWPTPTTRFPSLEATTAPPSTGGSRRRRSASSRRCSRGRGLVEIAGDGVIRAHRAQRGRRIGTVRHREGAAGAEAAAGGRIDRVGRIAGDRRAIHAPVGIHGGRRGKQRLRVGMLGRLRQRVGGAHLHHLTQVHDQHATADVLDHVQVVRDEHVGERALQLQLEQEIEHLGLHGLVERGDRLVEHQQLGIEHQRARDVDALALAAAQLVRVPATVETRVEPDAPQQRAGALAGLGARATVHEQAEGHRILDGQARVERRVGILEDQLHVAAQALHARRPGGPHILAGEDQGPRIRLDQSENQPGQCRFPAAGLADDTQRLARIDVERHVVDRAHPGIRALQHPAAQGEVLAQPSRLQQRRRPVARAHARISMASRRPSESRLNVIDVTKMARPGSAGTSALT